MPPEKEPTASTPKKSPTVSTAPVDLHLSDTKDQVEAAQEGPQSMLSIIEDSEKIFTGKFRSLYFEMAKYFAEWCEDEEGYFDEEEMITELIEAGITTEEYIMENIELVSIAITRFKRILPQIGLTVLEQEVKREEILYGQKTHRKTYRIEFAS